MRRLGTRLLVMLASVSGPAGALQASVQQDTSMVEAFVELRVFRGPQTIVDIMLLRDSTILVSVPQFLSLAEVRIARLETGHRLVSLVEPEALRVGFDTDANQFHKGDSTYALPTAHAAWRDGALYVATDVLARAYGIRITVDWDDLVVMVRGSERLPVIRRLERVRRRAMLATVRSSARPAYSIPVRQRFAGGAVLDWAVTSSTADPLGTTSVDLGFGTQMGGGSLDVRHRRQSFSGSHFNTSEATWTKAWSEGSWLRQLRVGDAFSTGRKPRRLRGVSVSNAPFVRARDFATEWFDNPLPEGWELELYRNGQLVGFASPDELEDFRFALPVRYGINPFDLVAYGPTGEVRRFRRNYVVPTTRLPAGEFEYSLAAGTCTGDPCRATLNLDTRYGLSRRVTVQAGVDFFWRDSLPNLWHPYGLVSAALTRTLSVTGEAVANASIGGKVEYIPTPDFEFSIEHVEFRSGTATPLLGSTTLERRTRGFLFWRPGKDDQAPYVRVSAIRTDATKLRSASVRLSSTARLGGTHLEVGAERRNRRIEGLLQSNNTILDAAATRVLLGPTAWLRSTFLRGRLAVDVDSGLTRAAALMARPITSDLRVELETSWQRGPRGFGIDLTLVTSLPTVRAVSHNRYSALDGIRGNQRIEGSLMWDRRSGRVDFGDGRSLGRAGLTGRVFYDADGDGERDPTEVGAPNIRIRVGSKGERTDSLGRFATWDLVPFEPVRLEIDSLSLNNPLWVPATPVMSAIPGPNSFTVVQVPLVRAGELSGRVVIDDATPVAGARIELRSVTTNVAMHTTSFSDGEFFFFGIPPGRYELLLSANHLSQLNATSEAVLFVVDPVGGTPAIDDVIVRLTRHPRSGPNREDGISTTLDTLDRLSPDVTEKRRLDATRRETAAARRLIALMVRFDFDRAVIRVGEDSTTLAQKLAILQTNTRLRIQITGHADERGTRNYNRSLGLRRAASVKKFLITRGIAKSRITIRSRGEHEPLDPGHTTGAWSQNRRVEFEITGGGTSLKLPGR